MSRQLTTEDLEDFFKQLQEAENNYIRWTGKVPKKLRINPKLLGLVARVPGFYQRPELQAEVTIFSPVVRNFKLENSVVIIYDDYDEEFMHFE